MYGEGISGVVTDVSDVEFGYYLGEAMRDLDYSAHDIL